MSKEVDNKICSFCESVYKLSYNPEETSGYSKYCPFCSEMENDTDDENDSEE
jgi:uncharacterized Zn-finger protein